jgi:metal transporter CNNM
VVVCGSRFGVTVNEVLEELFWGERNSAMRKTPVIPVYSGGLGNIKWGMLVKRFTDEDLTQAASWLEAIPRPLLFLLAFGCVGLGALMAGLTLGLMSLDLFQLELLAVSGASLEEKAAARAIAPLRAKGNQLLVTLLLTNTLANELLPLVLDTLFPGGYAALVLSVVSVVIFGEVLPQAVCSRYGLKVGAATAGFTRTLMAIFWPVASPAAWLLDKMLGKELRTGYDRDRLKALIQLHGPAGAATPADVEAGRATKLRDELSMLEPQTRPMRYAATGTTALEPREGSMMPSDRADNRWYANEAQRDAETRALTGSQPNSDQLRQPGEENRLGFSVLSADEASMLVGILELSSKTVRQVMTKAEDVFCLSVDDRLDRQMLKRILRLGHSRVPIYDSSRDNIIAILLVKQLLLVDPNKALPIRAIIRRKKRSHKKKVVSPVYVSQDCNLLDLLNEFQVGRSHMAIVVESLERPAQQGPRRFLGIVTLEDIVEEMIKEEVLDETDVFVDNEHRQPVLIRGSDNKWHYSIPPELLANRRRNPRFIQYRDIDESAYADATEIPEERAGASEQRLAASSVFATFLGVTAPSIPSKNDADVEHVVAPGCMPAPVSSTNTSGEIRRSPPSPSRGTSLAPEAASRRAVADTPSPTDVKPVTSFSSPATNAGRTAEERLAPLMATGEGTRDPVHDTHPFLMSGPARSTSESNHSLNSSDEEGSSHRLEEHTAAAVDTESASEAETDLEYDFEVGTYVEPRKLGIIKQRNLEEDEDS